MTDYKQLCAELVRIANALDSGAPLVGNQGQALDGYSALAAFRDVATRARAALARPEPKRPQPVPVSERLPGAEDCDAEGRCWWYGEGGDMVGWTLDAEGLSYYRAKYWLPAHALSVPTND